MKKNVLALLIATSVVSFAASASDNTITFQGEVTDETCSVTVNGNEASPVVLLPTVSAADLSGAGGVAGLTTFDVGVSGCIGNPTGITSISTVFVGNQVTADGNLGNTGSATDVDIQILETDGTTPIDLTSGFNGGGDLSLASGETEATATYSAQYFSPAGTAVAGTVEASLQYAVSYP